MIMHGFFVIGTLLGFRLLLGRRNVIQFLLTSAEIGH